MITVFGSINLDLIARVTRIPAPGETVPGTSFATAPGGKGANQALAAKRAGGMVRLVGAAGNDSMAEQALVLLNDPTYVEASRVLAQRAIQEAGADPQSRVRFLFREATSRRPSAAEVRVLMELAQRRLDHYRKDPAQAAKLIAIGASHAANVEATDLAAWTMVASTILNLDETITKE